MMRNQVYSALVATGLLTVAAVNTQALANPPDKGHSITLAQAQQPGAPLQATPAPTTMAPATGVQQQPSGMSSDMPGKMMQPRQGMMGSQGMERGQEMERGQGMQRGQAMQRGQGMQPGQAMQHGPMMQPGNAMQRGPGGGMPPCPAGQTMSGMPPACK